MDAIFHRLIGDGHPVNNWFYGHFHQSWKADISGVRFKMLDMLQMNSTQCYIDTGFKDTAVYGVRFGFYGNSGNSSSGWNFILGSGEGSSDSARGFVVGQASASYDTWFLEN